MRALFRRILTALKRHRGDVDLDTRPPLVRLSDRDDTVMLRPYFDFREAGE